MASWNLSKFSADVLLGLGIRPTGQAISNLNAWQLAEGGAGIGKQSVPSLYNPLNTTLSYGGSSSIPGNGATPVQSYTSYGNGVVATVQTLSEPAYAAIRQALSSGASTSSFAQTVGASSWGTPATGFRTGSVPSVTPFGSISPAVAAQGTAQGALPTTSSGAPIIPGAPSNGNPVGTAEVSAAGSVASAVGSAVLSPFESLAKNIGLFLFGAALVIVGLVMMMKDSSSSAPPALSVPEDEPEAPEEGSEPEELAEEAVA